MPHPLDNPIWTALTTEQAHFAIGDGVARVFHKEVSVLAGVGEDGADTWRALAGLAGARTVGNFMIAKPGETPGLEQTITGPLLQMEHTEAIPKITTAAEILTLGPPDVEEMSALVELTKPGPFSPRTIEMGDYLGVRENGRLVAMAGERLRLPGYVEVSAVCTHPDALGRGYAGALVSVLVERIHARRKRPFLHVRPENARAIALYRRLGFTERASLHLRVLRRPQASTSA